MLNKDWLWWEDKSQWRGDHLEMVDPGLIQGDIGPWFSLWWRLTMYWFREGEDPGIGLSMGAWDPGPV